MILSWILWITWSFDAVISVSCIHSLKNYSYFFISSPRASDLQKSCNSPWSKLHWSHLHYASPPQCPFLHSYLTWIPWPIKKIFLCAYFCLLCSLMFCHFPLTKTQLVKSFCLILGSTHVTEHDWQKRTSPITSLYIHGHRPRLPVLPYSNQSLIIYSHRCFAFLNSFFSQILMWIQITWGFWFWFNKLEERPETLHF